MKRTAGALLVGLSLMSWVGMFIGPVLELTATEAATTAAGLYVTSQITFLGALAVLRNQLRDPIRRWLPALNRLVPKRR